MYGKRQVDTLPYHVMTHRMPNANHRYVLRASCMLLAILMLSGLWVPHAVSANGISAEGVTPVQISDHPGLAPCKPYEEQFEEIDELLQIGRWTDAEVLLLQIKEMAPDCALVPLFHGRIHYYRRNDRQALALFNQLAVRHPDIYQTYHFRGLIYNDHGLHTVALEEFHKVMMVNTTIGSGYFLRYIFPFLQKDGKLDPAHIDSMLQYVTNIAAGTLTRGYLEFYQDNYPVALRHFKNVTAADPEHAGAWLYAGRSYEAMRWRLEAYHCYNKAIEIDETYARAWLLRGLVLISDRNWYHGCRDLHKAKELEYPAADMAIRNFCRRGRFP